MVDLTNIGTLFAFILVCGGIIVLRIKDPSRPRPFRVPGGLIIPILGIISCLYLIYFLPPTSWLRFAAWLNLGFVIYVGYSSVHSRLTGRQNAVSPSEHNAETAYIGAWLGLIGTGLLFFMRGFDLWLDALKNTDRTGSALGEAMKPGPWFEVSWFLIVPLALNVLVLCPIIFRRATRARQSGEADRHAKITRFSLIAAAGLALAGIIYLLLVYLHNAQAGN